MKRIKKILKYIGITLISIILIFAGFLGYMTLKDYRPAAIEDIQIQNKGAGKDSIPDTLSLFTWNIGYGGLGKEQDFFFEGGKMVRPTKEQNQAYMKGIIDIIQGMDSVDFLLLQEVDLGSKRSYFEDQVKTISGVLPSYSYGTAVNYKSLFVPQPVSNPYGKCYGGIVTYSKYDAAAARRFSLAPDATWPTGLFMLKRCFMEFRYPLANNKDLVLINLHLSAYDDGTVKQRQLDTLKRKLLSEESKGNYVVVGGDWNMYPPGYKPILKKKDVIVEKTGELGYPGPNWKWISDTTSGTNRKLYEPFVKNQTDEVVIDYFLVSSNINSLEVKVVDLGYVHSDHNPVYFRFVLGK